MLKSLISPLLVPLLAVSAIATSLHTYAGANGTYRWHDENGTVQYSDIPPEGVDAEYIKFTSAGKSREDDEDKAGKDAKNQADASGDKPKIYDKMEALPEKDPALCKQAQDNLKALDGARIRITEPDGTQRILTEDEKEIQRENARKFIKIHC